MVRPSNSPSPIDIIIPCFRGFEQTRRTIESVLSATTEISHHVVVIDDASPEPAISNYLSHLPSQVELIRHRENRGFVASVNEGMQLHADRDVLLLNSDTVVAAGWLDRIAAHANSQLHVASVTPLSNNASIASYPKIVKNNTVHVGDTASIDSLAARVNAGQSVEAPVGVGFCMWIARAALDVVGYFDEEQFGKGYGEEVEWCLRARQLGFKHVLAMDIFVHHAGEVSFGSGASAIRERAQMLVDAAFPSFSSDVQLFLARDTAYEWRRRLVLACDFAGVSHNEKQTVLHINTINGGGVDRFIRDVAAGVTSARHAVMHVGRQCTIVESINAGYVFQVDNVDVQAASILKALRVNMLHVHSTSAAVWNVVVALRRAMPSLGYVLTLHDILFVDDEAFSTETITPCQKTLLRTSQIAIEASATTAPSEFAAKLARQHLNVEPIILPNAIPLESPHALGTMDSVDAESAAFTQVVGDRPVFAVVGAIGPHKGSNVLESIMSQLPEDIFCVIVGYTDARITPGWISDRLFIHGPYISSQLTALLRAYHARVALFPNRIPESFSYVLSEVWQAGLPALVPSVGALEERVRCWGGGEVFANDAEPADIAHKIKVMVRSPPTQLPPHSPPAIADYTDMTQTLDRLYLKHANEHAWTLNADESIAAVEQFVKINLDGTEFRKELIRLIANNAELRISLSKHEAWQAHLEEDIATLKTDLIKTQEALEAQRSWCDKLEQDTRVMQTKLNDDAKRYRVVRHMFDRLPMFIQRTVMRWGSGDR